MQAEGLARSDGSDYSTDCLRCVSPYRSVGRWLHPNLWPRGELDGIDARGSSETMSCWCTRKVYYPPAVSDLLLRGQHHVQGVTSRSRGRKHSYAVTLEHTQKKRP
jgi:hypothetical protein